jgi:hypothetical protein
MSWGAVVRRRGVATVTRVGVVDGPDIVARVGIGKGWRTADVGVVGGLLVVGGGIVTVNGRGSMVGVGLGCW